MPASTRLLGADDPLPVTVLNPGARSPLLLVCDHASQTVPAALGGLGLPAAELARHIGWDIGAALVTAHLAERFDAAAVLSGYSRLVIDCNRAPGDAGSIPAVSDGTVIPGSGIESRQNQFQRNARTFTCVLQTAAATATIINAELLQNAGCAGKSHGQISDDDCGIYQHIKTSVVIAQRKYRRQFSKHLPALVAI